MSDDPLKVKITNLLPRFHLWTIGYLFTIGYLLEPVPDKFWTNLWQLLFAYVFWPLMLGLHFK